MNSPTSAPSSGRKSRKTLYFLTIALFVPCLCIGLLAACSALLPGDTFRGPLPLAGDRSVPLEAQLRDDVEHLAGVIGERNMANPHQLRAAANHIAAELSRSGYRVNWQTYTVRVAATPTAPASELPAFNLSVELPGATHPDEIILIGAHYDSVNNGRVRSPGANDNASGTAAVLALARRLAVASANGATSARTIRLAFFTNEEPPYFWTDQMGSLVYARSAKAKGEQIVAMLSIETIGAFSDAPGSQSYPPLVGLAYPDTANFIAFVGMADAEPLVRRCVESFRAAGTIAAEGAALPTLVPRVGSSDHWSFWKQGYPALMVTDTAPYRSRDYHKPTDTPEKLNYAAMAKVVEGLERVISDLASTLPPPISPSSPVPPAPDSRAESRP